MEIVIEKQKLVDIHILLVDDDSTSLAVVSAMLRVCKYQVVTFKNPIEALDTLRAKRGYFDLIVTDLHMPQMNGLELQKKVMQEFKLPVIMMSADEKPSVILKSLEEGVAFYMVKPISLDDVKHVWQYVIKAKKVITTPNQTTTTTAIIRRELSIEKSSFKDHHSSSSASSWTTPCSKEETAKSKNKKAKANRVTKKSIATRKEKVIWTNSLHNRFLQAIREVGLHNAVPKKILEFMNVPGLTRENVASHLQKYRIFLKRVAEKGASSSMKIYSDYTLLRSNFASAHFNRSKFQSQHPNFPLNYQCPPSLGANYLSHLTPPNPNFGNSLSFTHLGNPNYSSLLTPNTPNFPFNGLVSSSTQDDRNFVLMGNENPKCSSNGEADRMSCSGQSYDQVCNVEDPHDLNNNNGGLLSLDGGCAFSENFEGIKHQLLDMICKTNVEENGSATVLVSSEEDDQVNVSSWKASNETISFGDIGEHSNYFDVLSEIFTGHNHDQPSLRKEEMGDMDLSHIWNGIEMDASAEQDLQPSGRSAQGWDDDILETFFGDGSS